MHVHLQVVLQKQANNEDYNACILHRARNASCRVTWPRRIEMCSLGWEMHVWQLKWQGIYTQTHKTFPSAITCGNGQKNLGTGAQWVWRRSSSAPAVCSVWWAGLCGPEGQRGDIKTQFKHPCTCLHQGPSRASVPTLTPNSTKIKGPKGQVISSIRCVGGGADTS